MNPNSKTIYLAGPIAGRTDAECNNWRAWVKDHWRGQTLDPMRRDGRGREQQPGIVSEIVEGDKDDIQKSDAVLVYYVMPTVGTSMEILFAWMHQVPVVVVNASMKPEHELSYWIRYHAAKICPDLQSALRELEVLTR